MLMNNKVHVIFFILLMIILYSNPKIVMELTNSFLGKLLLIIFVIVIGQKFDNKAAFLSSVIVILLLQNVKEGLEVMGTNIKETKTEEKNMIDEITKNILNKAQEDINKDKMVALNGGTNTGGDIITNDLTRNQINTRGSDDLLTNIKVAENNEKNDLVPTGNISKTVEGFASIM
jgi:hypothetical protein